MNKKNIITVLLALVTIGVHAQDVQDKKKCVDPIA